MGNSDNRNGAAPPAYDSLGENTANVDPPEYEPAAGGTARRSPTPAATVSAYPLSITTVF